MKLTDPWLTSPTSQRVCRVLTDAGYAAYFVGGCVRNALIGAPVSDLDISTDARPQTVMDLAQDAGLTAIPTGIDHGTITVVCDGIPHEITTFRKDVATDGRRAVVAFADTMAEDAHRRDFTMNALYADASGQLFDPLEQGLADLEKRHLRFIDDAEQRIQEDYLRIMRFFRFYAWYGDPMEGPDRDALAAIAANSAGIETLSRERVGAEMLKLLSAVDPAPALAMMRSTGVLACVLPGSDDKAIGPLNVTETGLGLDPAPIRRLVALGGDTPDLRLTNEQKRHYSMLKDGVENMVSPGEIGFRHGIDAATEVLALRVALFETGVNPDDLQQAQLGADAKFPVKAADLMPDYTGAALGKKLKTLEARWIASKFTLGKSDLLN